MSDNFIYNEYVTGERDYYADQEEKLDNEWIYYRLYDESNIDVIEVNTNTKDAQYV